MSDRDFRRLGIEDVGFLILVLLVTLAFVWLSLPFFGAILWGVVPPLSLNNVYRRWSGFGEFARQAPYFSGALILLVGVYLGYQGLQALV